MLLIFENVAHFEPDVRAKGDLPTGQVAGDVDGQSTAEISV